jgi:hypothetical protein
VRIALFVVVAAVHLLVIWLLMPSRRLGLEVRQEELELVPISMLPERPVEPKTVATAESRGRPNLAPRAQPSAESNTKSAVELAAVPDFALLPSNTEPPDTTRESASDWWTQVEITAQSSALQIVTAEDDAKRRANALTAPYKPMPGPRARGPRFGWDPYPLHRFTPAGEAGFVFRLSDRCAMVVVIIPWFGCSVGWKPPANGDLFKYMHGPVKFGDWDWRVQDP